MKILISLYMYIRAEDHFWVQDYLAAFKIHWWPSAVVCSLVGLLHIIVSLTYSPFPFSFLWKKADYYIHFVCKPQIYMHMMLRVENRTLTYIMVYFNKLWLVTWMKSCLIGTNTTSSYISIWYWFTNVISICLLFKNFNFVLALILTEAYDDIVTHIFYIAMS